VKPSKSSRNCSFRIKDILSKPATKDHIGTSFDDFLEEEGILDECKEKAKAWKQALEQGNVPSPASHTSRPSGPSIGGGLGLFGLKL
jgi:hypothetical protein